MPDDASRTPRQPKLRTSCDACGATKVKCDRGQPRCGRCLSHGMACVYGISRKMGKPPRERPRPGLTPAWNEHAGAADGGCELDKPRSSGSSISGAGSISGTASTSATTLLDSAPSSSSVTDLPAAWDALDDGSSNPSGLLFPFDAFDGIYSDLPEPVLPPFASLDFSDWAFADHSNDSLLSSTMPSGPISTTESPGSGSLSSAGLLAAQPMALQSHADKIPYPEAASMPDVRGHDCLREAHEILGSLSCLNVSKTRSVHSPPTSSASTAPADTANRVPLDHVLRLNREASDRLGHLLTYPCARSPPLSLLYASIISRVLIWYQQAAGCTQSAAWSPPSTTSGFNHGSSGRGGSGKTGPTLTQSTGLAVEQQNMAIGSFNVDDMRVQTALKVQLLSSEMRRAGRLIEQFTAYNSGGVVGPAEESAFGGVDSLYQTLDSWLRGEHARIENMMRSKLRELNT